MQFFDFSCPNCKTHFGISIENELDISSVFCVECGASDIILEGFDQELSVGLTNLIDSVNDLAFRVNAIEDEINDSGFNITSSKQETDIN